LSSFLLKVKDIHRLDRPIKAIMELISLTLTIQKKKKKKEEVEEEGEGET